MAGMVWHRVLLIIDLFYSALILCLHVNGGEGRGNELWLGAGPLAVLHVLRARIINIVLDLLRSILYLGGIPTCICLLSVRPLTLIGLAGQLSTLKLQQLLR